MGSIISGISLTCFAASYGVAWVLELAKLLLRSGARQVLMLGFVLAGLVGPHAVPGLSRGRILGLAAVEQLRLVPGGGLAAGRGLSCI